MKVVIGHLNSGIRKVLSSEIKNKSDKEIKALKDALNDKDVSQAELLQKIQDYEDSKLDVDKQAEVKAQRIIEAANKKATDFENTAKTNYNLFEEKTIETDIYAAFSGHQLNDTEDTMLIIRNRFTPKVVKDESTGRFKTVLIDPNDPDKKEQSAKEAVDAYLSLPKSAHLLASNLKPGGGSRSGGRIANDGTLVYSDKEMQKNPELRREYHAKMKAGEKVKITD